MRYIFVTIINWYQALLSPDHSWYKSVFPYGYCRYFPSCSEYTKQAIVRYGIIYGIGKGLWRIVRCNPFSKGGIDNHI